MRLPSLSPRLEVLGGQRRLFHCLFLTLPTGSGWQESQTSVARPTRKFSSQVWTGEAGQQTRLCERKDCWVLVTNVILNPYS